MKVTTIISLVQKILISCVFLFVFHSAQAALLTCGGDKTDADCIAAGGTVVTIGTCTSCSISGTTCPSGMTQYLNWIYYTSKSCGSTTSYCKTGNCGTKCVTPTRCTTSSSDWLNSAAAPSCSYLYANEYTEGFPSCTYCEDMSSFCQHLGEYAASCVNRQSAGCAVSNITSYRLNTQSSTCYSIKSKIACIGSGVAPVTSEEDCGFRMFSGATVYKAACESVGSTTSPLRIGKNGVIRGIILVDTTDSNASPVRIKTAAGIKAIKKFGSAAIIAPH